MGSLGWVSFDAVAQEVTVDFFRADLKHATRSEQSHALEQVDGALDIDADGVQGDAHRRWDADDRGAVNNSIRAVDLEGIGKRRPLHQVADKGNHIRVRLVQLQQTLADTKIQRDDSVATPR